MATGGRVLHHLEAVGPDNRSTILLAGFQAAGTRGEALANGARDLKIFGKYIPVRARVARIDALSAHADADELLGWLRTVERPPAAVSIVHGEPTAADVFRRRIADELDWSATIAAHGTTINVSSGSLRHTLVR